MAPAKRIRDDAALRGYSASRSSGFTGLEKSLCSLSFALLVGVWLKRPRKAQADYQPQPGLSIRPSARLSLSCTKMSLRTILDGSLLDGSTTLARLPALQRLLPDLPGSLLLLSPLTSLPLFSSPHHTSHPAQPALPCPCLPLSRWFLYRYLVWLGLAWVVVASLLLVWAGPWQSSMWPGAGAPPGSG